MTEEFEIWWSSYRTRDMQRLMPAEMDQTMKHIAFTVWEEAYDRGINHGYNEINWLIRRTT